MPELIVVDARELGAVLPRLRALGRQLPRVMVRAINRTLAGASTDAKRAIVSATGLPARRAARALSIRRATVTTLEGAVVARDVWIPLLAYAGRRRWRSGQGVAGLPIRVGIIPEGAFFALMPSGHAGIFRRRGAARLPITELPGPSLPRVIVERALFRALGAPARARLRQRLEHEAARVGAAAASGDD